MVAALLGPLEGLSARSLAAHMSQHLVLMAVAAPLLVLGLPPRVLLSPVLFRSSRGRRRWARWLRWPMDARWLGLLHTAVLVLWHLPRPVNAALGSEPMHMLMHVSFLAVALPFWAAVLRVGTRQGESYAAATLLLFSLMTVMALMGAILALAPRPLYAAYPLLSDQQLAGLVMWVPGTLPYLAAGVWLSRRWLFVATRRSVHSD
jgi:putative membrane protein